MSIQTLAVVAILVTLPMISQTTANVQQGARRDGAIIAADYDYDEVVSTCSLSVVGDQPVLAATLMLPVAGPGGGPHVRSSAGFDIVPATGGGMPTVTAMAINSKGTGATANGRQKHAINTKGTGGTNGRMAAPSCDARPSPGPTMTGTMRAAPPAPSCALSDDGSSAMISVPLSAFGAGANPSRGHVTLMKRGADNVAAITGGAVAGIVVACTAAKGGPKTAGWDLAVGKK